MWRRFVTHLQIDRVCNWAFVTCHCMKAEQNDRQTMINEWSTFSADDRRHCVSEATMGGESSYTDLLTCLEMARDVRKLHSEAANSSPPAQQVPQAPVGHRQPTRQ